MPENLTLFPILFAISGGIITAFIPETANKLRNILVIVTTAAVAIVTWLLLPTTLSGQAALIEGTIGGLSWQLRPDALGMVFALISSSLWLLAAIYSIGYMSNSKQQRRYFSFYLLSLGVTLGIALAANLLVLYIFYELLTFVTYPLVIHRQDRETLKAGNRYIRYSLIGAGFILAGLISVSIMTNGDLNFNSHSLLQGYDTNSKMVPVLLLFLIGFGVKAAVMPLHRWLPTAMLAPTPVSALLHAVAVVNAGIFGILRIIYSVFGYEVVAKLNITPYLLIVVAITIIAASWIALNQDILKRRLAYSTISQLSYILLGAFLLHPLGLTGAIVHMINHSILKIILFFSAGIIAETTNKTKISQLMGLGKALPLVFICFGCAGLGMIGMLPLNGFWSKYYLMLGSNASGFPILIAILLFSALLNAIYFLPIPVNAFLKTDGIVHHKLDRNGMLMLVPTCFLVLLAIILGIWPNLTQPLIDAVINQFFI